MQPLHDFGHTRGHSILSRLSTLAMACHCQWRITPIFILTGIDAQVHPVP